VLKIYQYAVGAIFVAALVFGLYFGYKGKLKSEYLRGKSEVQALWKKSDELAAADGAIKTKSLALSAVRNSEKTIDTLNTLNARVATRTVERNQLRDQLERHATSTTSSDPARAACRSDEERVRSCERLLSTGIGLVEQGQGLLERSEAKLTALQEHAVILQMFKETK
jgi:hypothetical protein